MVGFGRAVFEICERTNRQTDIHADLNTLHLSLTGVDVSDGEALRCDTVDADPASVDRPVQHVEQCQMVVVAHRRQVKGHHHRLRHRRIHRTRTTYDNHSDVVRLAYIQFGYVAQW